MHGRGKWSFCSEDEKEETWEKPERDSLNACVLPKFIYLNLIPDVMIFGTWLGYEDRMLKNEISAFIKETHKVP